MDRRFKGTISPMKRMVLPGMLALSLLLAACSKKERARATVNSDPEITNVDTNEIAKVDYRQRLQDRRDNIPEDDKVFAS
jgi:major membrane immunogen (membrane-anchored lipoprotein)